MILVWRPICCSFSLASQGYFCFLNQTLSCLSAWPPRSFTSLYFQGYPHFYNSPHLTSVLSFHLWPHYFNTQYFILSSSFSKPYPAPIESQKLWGTGAPGQHGGTYLDLSQPCHGGHSIQMPLRHKDGTHKVTHLLNHSAWKSTFKQEKCINHSVLQGVH